MSRGRGKKPAAALESAINQGRNRRPHGARLFIEIQGGLPVIVDGQVIGGISASFDSPKRDLLRSAANRMRAAVRRAVHGESIAGSSFSCMFERHFS
jgi:uncharacterized protein GlcG (DUF336 family)